jgi:serine/threonine protein kinase
VLTSIKRAVVKTATTDLERAVLRREYRSYQHDQIASSPFIRKMYEGIGNIEDIDNPIASDPPCLVFEWMDTELRSIPSSQFRSGELPKQVARSVLSALEVFYFMDAVHTGSYTAPSVVTCLPQLTISDVNPNNVLVSGVNDPVPTVKLADLGMCRLPPLHQVFSGLDSSLYLVLREGVKQKRLQSLPCRAPEVWMGLGVHHASDVWSLGITVRSNMSYFD